MIDKLPPQNIEAEEAILGGIMLDPEGIDRVSDAEGGKQRLIGEAFYISAHKDIYQAAQRLHCSGKPTHLLTVTATVFFDKSYGIIQNLRSGNI